MKKRKLIGGILLMIIGLGISAGSVVFHHIEHNRYAVRANGFSPRGGNSFRDFNGGKLNPIPNPSPNPGQKQFPRRNPRATPLD